MIGENPTADVNPSNGTDPVNGVHFAADVPSGNGKDSMNGTHIPADVRPGNGKDSMNGMHIPADVRPGNGKDSVNGTHSIAGVHSSHGEDPVNRVYENGQHSPEGKYPKPLELSGVLNQFESFRSTPCIGIEFPKANLVEWLRAPNSDELIRELGITIAQRGVVFFRGQTELSDALHKELIFRLGQLTGRPRENGLYKHPLWKIVGDKDPHCSALDNSRLVAMYRGASTVGEKVQSIKIAWHSDISFEPNPPDFSSLRLTQLPVEGGDTLWASGYEVYDRFSKPFQNFLESLTATYSQKKAMSEKARSMGLGLEEGPRGAPANIGTDMEAVHPVIRTHPVTGWKSVYAMGTHCKKINGVTQSESQFLQDRITSMVTENHDIQVRFRWQTPSDIAIWDNRCAYHAPTPDYRGSRGGWRVLGVGEVPYIDPNSVSRAEGLAMLGKSEIARGSIGEHTSLT